MSNIKVFATQDGLQAIQLTDLPDRQTRLITHITHIDQNYHQTSALSSP